jgi:signal transduction histidine kinase
VTALALAGWLAAGALALAAAALRGRLHAVSAAAHELRGATGVLALAVATLRREPGGLRRALALESELERMRAGLADLDAARQGRRRADGAVLIPAERVLRLAAAGWRPAAARRGRRVRLRWQAGGAVVRADRGRLAQALGNLLANALDHGTGPVLLTGRRRGRSLVLEVADAGPAGQSSGVADDHDRGHGLAIAARAAEEAGGSLTVTRSEQGTTAALELPLADR